MGEVYRALDTRLERVVALKVLPADVAADPVSRARFEHEARAISAVTHPHICTLHDVGEECGRMYLVMEHLAGETLAQRLKKGALPLPRALEISIQIADALATAHKQGVVHRDLKPGNVMLTRTGVKLLDFGIAALAGEGPEKVPEAPLTPTASVRVTTAEKILGTIPYVAPEQLEGGPTDARTDLWALGTLVHEMVTGRRAFEGTGQVGVAAAILESEPHPLRSLQPLAPPALERLVRRCLAKSPDDRWDTAHDVAEELRWIAQASFVPPGAGGAGRRWTQLAAGALVVAAAVAAGALAERALRVPASPRAPVVRSWLDVAPAAQVTTSGASLIWLPTPGGSRTALSWTPDGRALVFVGERNGVARLYVRELDRDEARLLPGTDSTRAFAVSPDGRWVAFWADGAVRRIPIDGGPVTLLARVLYCPSGIACGTGGEVFYDGPDQVIWRASPGVEPKPATKRQETEVSHGLPALLPGDRVLLYTSRGREWTWGDERVVAQDLATGARKVLLPDAADARYVSSGHLVFLRRGTLFGVGFDPVRLEVRGTPLALMDGVAQALAGSNTADIAGPGQFSVAGTGALAYLPGAVASYPNTTLVAVDRRGQARPLPAPVRSYSLGLAASPDGRHLAISIHGLTERPLWLVDLTRGTLTKLTPEGEATSPQWAPDGRRVAFAWVDAGRRYLAWQRSDGTAPPEVLVHGDGRPSSWSRDGRWLLFVKDDDIWAADVQESGATARPVTHTPQLEWWPEISPDGSWLAYGSDVSGRSEIYVTPWPGPGPAEQVTTGGGESPAWNPSGHELFFLNQPGEHADRLRMMSVEVRTSPALSVGTPRPLFDFSLSDVRFLCVPVRCYGVAPDGRAFFVTRQPATAASPAVARIQLVQGWVDELRARVPSGLER
jgi:Tol biopolymer transport system component